MLALNTVSLAQLGDIISRLDVSLAIFGLVFYVVVTAIRGWRYLLCGAKVPFRTAFHIAALHSTLLRVMPLRSGELVYGMLMKQSGGSGFVAGMAVVFLIRVLDLAVVLPLAAIVIAVNLSGKVTWTGIIAIAALGILLSALFFLIKPILKRIKVWSNRSGNTGIGRKIDTLLDVLLSAYALPIKSRILLVGITVLMWTALLVWYHFTFLSIGAIRIFGESIVVSVLGVLGSILPLSLIGSFGPMEGGFVLGLSLVGQDQATAIANALIGSTVTFLCGAVVAVPSWVAFMLDVAEKKGVRYMNSVRQWLGSVSFSILGALLFLYKIPYGFETNDQYQYLLLPYRTMFPDFLVGDWFTWHTSHYHYTFSWLIQGLYAVVGPQLFPYAVFSLHFLVLMGLAYGVLSVARAMKMHWGAAAFAVLTVAFVSRMGIAETVVNHGVLLPADIAMPLFLIAVAFWIEEKPKRAGLFLGLAGFIHANFAILGPLAFAVPELIKIARTRQIKGTLQMAGLFLIVAAPTLVGTVSAFWASDAAPEALSVLFKVRSPHHYSPILERDVPLFFTATLVLLGLPAWLSPIDGAYRHSAVVLSLVGLEIVAIVASVTGQMTLIRLFFWRLSSPLILISAVAVGHFIVSAAVKRTVESGLYAMSALIIVAAFAANGSIAIAPHPTVTGFGFMSAAAMALVLVAALRTISNKYVVLLRHILCGLPLVVAVLVSKPTAIVADDAVLHWEKATKKWATIYSVDEHRILGKRPTKAIYRWVADNTPKDAVFLIPPGNDDFRFSTRRAVFVDWKCCPMKGEEIREWERRMLAAMGTRRFPATGYRLYPVSNKYYLSRTLVALATLARKEGISHIMTKQKKGFESAGLKPLVTRDGWTVYMVLDE